MKPRINFIRFVVLCTIAVSGGLVLTPTATAQSTSASPAQAIVEEQGLVQLSDTAEIDTLIDGVIAANPEPLANYRAGKETLFGFFVGQVIKASKGKANPKVVNERLRAKLQG